MYEGGVRTPMIAYWPGKIKAGQITDHISAFWDISPTLRELAGAAEQEDTDGISMVPTLLGSGQQKKHNYLYWEFFEKGGKRAIRMGKWKLILYNTNSALNPKMELFDLEADISEKIDLSKQFPEKVSALLKVMDKAHTPAENPTFKFASERSPQELESLSKPKKKRKK
jgi:arylsulfatase A-like enzyme